MCIVRLHSYVGEHRAVSIGATHTAKVGSLLRLTTMAALLCVSAMARGGDSVPPVNVVLVHGFLNNGKIFDPLIRRLEREGCRCFAPALHPNTCSLGVDDLAHKLSAQIDQHFGRQQPFVIIGFSMGGIVTRDYVQNLARRKRVRGVFLISPPNQGTLWAGLSPSGGTRELAIGSPFLKRLNSDDTVWKEVPVTTYWTPYDLMIVPARSSLWPVGQTRRVSSPPHPLMARNPDVMADIAAKLQEMRHAGLAPVTSAAAGSRL